MRPITDIRIARVKRILRDLTLMEETITSDELVKIREKLKEIIDARFSKKAK